MSWKGWLDGLNVKSSSGIDKEGKPYVKSESLKGDDKSHDHSWVKTTFDGKGGSRTQMGYVDRNSCTRSRGGGWLSKSDD